MPNNAIAIKNGIDYSHLNIKNLNLETKKIDYTAETISGKIVSFAVTEKSGLAIESFKTDFFYGQKESYLKNLSLKTPQTSIQNEIVVGYNSLSNLSNNIGDLIINANFENSRIGVKDLLIFVPKFRSNKLFTDNLDSEIKINTKISGQVKNLSIPIFQFSGITLHNLF